MTLWQQIQNFFFVTLLAVLIWNFAEGENRKEHTETLSIQFAPAPDLIIVPDQSQVDTPNIKFTCTTAQYEMFKKLQKQIIRIPILDATTKTIYLREKLNADKDLKAAGLVIGLTEPSTVTLEKIERLVSKSLPVKVLPLTGDYRFATPPTTDPSQVTVLMPESLAKLTDGLWLEVKLDPGTFTSDAENVPRTLEVPLTLSDVFWQNFTQKFSDKLPRSSVVINKSSVNLTLAIHKQTEKLNLPFVQVMVTAPPMEISRFAVTLDADQQVLQDVKCEGPVEAIERIRPKEGNAKVTARFVLSTEELEQAADKGPRTATLILDVPPGVRADPPLPSVRFTVTRLALPGTSPASPPVSLIPEKK